jgi:hypothetical protein
MKITKRIFAGQAQWPDFPDLFIIGPLVDGPSQTRCQPDMKSKQLAEVTGF